ncbi:hypothetical protein KEM60_02911 [Austwickia sp. TVS 96-490-7B]|uniref:MFS transporter n=1 Tax=Austwickia sp. TVS 96-490-7B TaxID=2830843 RepID=UPI001C5792C9|nr:MFS transporter [Austwickia sp. TVS 96-490-7B]MBW3086682.1 hypothetical protein [Austwickia sp. TVS 96-490-7B]
MTSATVPAPRVSLPAAAGWSFLVAGFVGRLPAAAIQLGLLMFVGHSGYGYGVGGFAVAAVGVGTALGAPVVGRLVDRYGPLSVLSVVMCVQLLGLAAVTSAVLAEAPVAVLLVAAALVGAANPQIGSVARARWSHLARRDSSPDLVRVALGYEGACDEISFVVGPIVAGLLFGNMPPVWGMGTLAASALVGQGLFMAYLWQARTSWADAVQAPATVGHEGLRVVGVLAPMATCIAVGAVFGSVQTALVVVNRAQGNESLTGVVYGCVGIGSAVASVLVVRLSQRIGFGMRVAVGAMLVVAGTCGVMTIPSVPVSALWCGLLGVGAGMMLVTSFAQVERVASASVMASAMTLLATCIVVGVAVGAAGSGWLSSGATAGLFWPTLAAAVVAMAASVGFRRSVTS